MIAGLKTRSSVFAQNTQGTIAMMFGLYFLVFAFAAGMAIDYGRTTHMRSRVAAAVDAAALAGGRALLNGQLNDQEVEEIAKQSFLANMADVSGTFGTVADPVIVIDRASGTVSINAQADVPMTFTKIAGYTNMVVPVTTTSKFDQRDVELGMALDVTGSMGGQKIADLRDAATDLVDILLPDGGNTNTIRIGLAPYATSINAGAFAPGVTGVPGANCVIERGGSEAFSDQEPVGSNVLGFSSGTACPSAIVQPLTDNKVALKNALATYNAGGWTAGHLGLAWAWYLVSPNWSSVWPTQSEPVAYSNTETIKAVILMTDGQFNTWYVSGNGNSTNQASSLCSQMKNSGVIVYSVAFQVGGAAEALLKGCATSPDTYFPASSGAELRASFQQIAQNLNKLRLTN